MNNTSKSLGFYMMIALAVLMLVFVFRNGFATQETYTNQQFERAVAGNEIARVDIHPNAQVPTGQLIIYFNGSQTTEKLNVADVKQVQEELEAKDIPVYMYGIEKRVFL